ncbi:MAG TPA: hypothetical protein VMV94_18985 [Phycisphaerae bacterium]|nr:hypothetical protein [Phycisphaerae bacterium]
MTSHQHPDIRWQRAKVLARLGAAVAAGGAFAALSWNSAPPPDETADESAIQRTLQAAERQSVVTEDDALPQLEARDAVLHGDASWGRVPALTGSQAAPVDALRSNVATGIPAMELRLTDQTERNPAMTTAVPHSRSPP